ncbi:MAG: hypothetical protein ABIL09_07845 [Gemmatimonadota bacterium]
MSVADRATDTAAIRQILTTVDEGWSTNDSSRVQPHYDDAYVGFSAAGGRYELAAVSHTGPESLRFPGGRVAPDTSDSSGSGRYFEVIHVDVRGDDAIALTQHMIKVVDRSEGQSVTDQWQTVWMLKRNGMLWKITATLARTSSDGCPVPCGFGPRPMWGMCDGCSCVQPQGYCLKPNGALCNYQSCSACGQCRY